VRRDRFILLLGVEVYSGAGWTRYLRARAPALLPATGMPNLPQGRLKIPYQQVEINIMNIPGFTAEASIYKMGWLYFAASDFGLTESGIFPQGCDPVCLDNCGDLSDCDDPDLTPKTRAACRAHIIACRRRCCPTPPPPRCDPCVPGPCSFDSTSCTASRGPGTQLCHNANGTTFTRPC